MGGAVSSGRNNRELIDNLLGSNFIRSREVELVFRAVDRADYMLEEFRDQAYKDLAWRSGPLHMSAPCIYCEVMESLKLKEGMSFLNIGSGTGYLSTLAGLVLSQSGVNHGVEVNSSVIDYANKRLTEFLQKNKALDEFEFCPPKFFLGNALCLAPLQAGYDRVYCGAGCPDEYQNYMKQLIKVGGILVMPLNDSLLQVKRESASEWTSRNVLSVSFAALREPTKAEKQDPVKLDDIAPPALQELSRGCVRGQLRARLLRQHAELRAPPPPGRPKRAAPRSICIPVDEDSDVDDLNDLHDLDREGGAHEMNALLSLVLSMGQNHVAGAIRFDPTDSAPSDSSDDEDGEPPGAAAAVAALAPADRERLAAAGEALRIPPGYRRDIVAEVISRAAARNNNRNVQAPRRAGRLAVTLEYNDPSDDLIRIDSGESESSLSDEMDDDEAEADSKVRKRQSQSSLDAVAESSPEAAEAEASGSTEAKEPKRQKFDSGIGDDSGPSDESVQKKSDEEADGQSSSQNNPTSDGSDDKETQTSPAPAPGLTVMERRAWRRSVRLARLRRPRDARRERLARLLRDAVRALPLPRLYKRYLDYCRDEDM